MESEIRTQKSLESGIQELGIRNPDTRNPESGAWNPESTIRLDSLTWGENKEQWWHTYTDLAFLFTVNNTSLYMFSSDD